MLMMIVYNNTNNIHKNKNCKINDILFSDKFTFLFINKYK